MKEVRGSEIHCFQGCRKRWHYEWIMRLEPKAPNDKLFFGSVFHKFLEVYKDQFNYDGYNKGFDAAMEMFRNAPMEMNQLELGDLEDLFTRLAPMYRDYWANQDKQRETLATELKFRVPIPEWDDYYYTGTIDHAFADHTDWAGQLWLEDHKTVSSIEKYSKAAEYDRQITRYLWAFDRLALGKGEILVNGEWLQTALPKPIGMVYNLVGKKLPEPPKQLKNGSLSKDKSQRTTLDLYMEALKEHGIAQPVYEGTWIIPKEYDEILDHLRAQETAEGNPYFRRIHSRRSDWEKLTMLHEMQEVIYDMERAKELSHYYRNITQACEYCPMKALCFAEAEGANHITIQQTLYQVKTEESDKEGVA